MSETYRRILTLLGSGEFVSGDVLGEALGVSRTAVWKHLNRLAEWGVDFEKVRGRGYRISGGMELLIEERILEAMSDSARSLVSELRVMETTDSTNNVVRAEIEQGINQGFVCFSERQSNGRGRHGRHWVSPFGRNIYMSMSWDFEGGAAAMEGLSLAVGVAVGRAIEALGVAGVGLKWPNDILLDKRKVGGVLLEMMGDPVGVCQVIVGIGLNLGMPQDIEVDQPWADLGNYVQIGRNSLAGALLSELLPMLKNYAVSGFPAYRVEWESYDAYRDRYVELLTPRAAVRGYGRGVTDKGAIQIEANGKVAHYSGGEISLRSASDT